MKIHRVYWTPFRDGLVLLYQTQNENVFRFSNNKNMENNVLDFSINSDSAYYRINYDETVTNVIWMPRSEYVRLNLDIAAIICLN